MSKVVDFPTRLSARPLDPVFRFGAVGDLEVLLMHRPGDEPAPIAIVVRAGTAVVEIATAGCTDDPAAALRDAHTFADALYAALKVIRERGVLRDAFVSPGRSDDGDAA